MVSIRDLLGVTQVRPATDDAAGVPRGLEGVVVAETSVGDVQGRAGFFHYRQYSATELAARRSLEDVWQLLFVGALPDRAGSARFTAEVAKPAGDPRRSGPHPSRCSPRWARRWTPCARRSHCWGRSSVGAPPTTSTITSSKRQALRLCSVIPTVLTAVYRLQQGSDPVPPRPDLSHAANYLWMLNGVEASPAQVRAIEQYMILTVDHGFNASTFAARVIASTGADLAAAIVGAIGAMSGPLHGGAPSRALDMLDAIGSPDRAEPWIRAAVTNGDRIMGFGHRVYKTDDPRSLFLRHVVHELGGDLADFAEQRGTNHGRRAGRAQARS